MRFFNRFPAFLVLMLVAAPAFAQEISPVNSFLSGIREPLITFVGAVLSALGLVVTYFVAKVAPVWATKLLTDYWSKMVDSGAGWLAKLLRDNPAWQGQVLTETHPAVMQAAAMAKQSFPEAIAKVQPATGELEREIIASFGRLLPQGVDSAFKAIR